MYAIKNKDDLLKTNEVYDQNIELWNFYYKSYKGGKDLINAVVKKNPRESTDNFEVRKSECFSINYNSSIVDLLSFYLTENAVENYFGVLNEDPAWKLFVEDCDLFETNFNVYLNEVQKLSSIFGSVGVLVDKPSGTFNNKAEELEYGIRPYVTTYSLQNILDWEYGVNEYGKAELNFVKLKNIYDEYVVWYRNFWQVFRLDNKNEIVLVREGENPLNEIPFKWLKNIKDPLDPFIGLSDLREIAYITAAIIRNFSSANEIIKYAAFPMLLKPQDWGPNTGNETVVSEKAILDFNPELGDAGKPEWLEPVVKDPIEAIIKYEEKLIDEIYRIAHLSGIKAQELSSQARSGVAMRFEFMELGSLLNKKSNNLAEFTKQIVRLWLKWQNQTELIEEISIESVNSFGLDDFSTSVDMAAKVIDLIPSDKFQKQLLKNMLRSVLPNLNDKIKNEIDEEIESLQIIKKEEENNEKNNNKIEE